MKRFAHAHATHPQWRMATSLVLAQLRAQMALPEHPSHPSLGLLYITDHYAAHAEAILEAISAELTEVTDWVGTVGVGVCANNVEYFDEPALAVMLCDLTPDQYRVFSGVAPLNASGREGAGGFIAHTALVHADGQTPEVADLIAEMADRTASGYLFGGLTGSRGDAVQFALGSGGNLKGQGAAGGVFRGGLSGVAFSADVGVISRIAQGAQPISPEHVVTAAEGNVVVSLDGERALEVLLRDLKITLSQPEHAMPRLRQTFVGLSRPAPGLSARGAADPTARQRGAFGAEVVVRHLIGLDPARSGVAVADLVPVGSRLAFCERHVHAARADLVRVCAEVREELESQEQLMGAGGDVEPAPRTAREMVGAVYVSCVGRGGPHFGGPSAELQVVRRALGDVPLVGFFAGGEIAHHRLYGYSGVLTVFTRAVG